jgi:hypothetical protein
MEVVLDSSAGARQSMESSSEIAISQPNAGPKKRRKHVASKLQLLTREQLDGRTNAAKFLNQLVTEIEADLGGREQLSNIERQLIEAFAGSCVTMQHLNTMLALGKEVDLSQHAAAVGAMVRVASRLGIQRRMRNIGPSLGDILAADLERQREVQS